MNTGERVLYLRKKVLKISQEQFGASLGLSKSAISKIEKKMHSLTDSNVLSICRAYKVNEEWLRHGTGEIFAVEGNELEYLIGRYGNTLSDLQKQLMVAIIKMTPAQCDAAESFFDYLISLRNQ